MKEVLQSRQKTEKIIRAEADGICHPGTKPKPKSENGCTGSGHCKEVSLADTGDEALTKLMV